MINKTIKWNTAQDTDSSVARHNGATHFMVLLNLKGDKMKKTMQILMLAGAMGFLPKQKYTTKKNIKAKKIKKKHLLKQKQREQES